MALITGADSGIGRAVAVLFAREVWTQPLMVRGSSVDTCGTLRCSIGDRILYLVSPGRFHGTSSALGHW